MKCVFIHNNASSHVSKLTHEFFEHKRITGEKKMEWPPTSPDMNPIENLWSFEKMKLYEGGKQYNSKADQWIANTTMLETELAEVKNIYKINVNRLMAVIEKNVHNIKMWRIQRFIICVYYLSKYWSIFYSFIIHLLK